VTVSTSTVIRYSLNQLIQEAFDIIGVGAEGEDISADMYRRGKMSAALMTQTFNAMENLWRKDEVTLTLVGSQAAYTLENPKPLRILSGRRRYLSSGYDTPMTMWSRQEYLDMPNKTVSTSTPLNFYYDNQRDDGVVYLWPAPSDGAATQYSVILDTLRPMFVMDATNDTLDMPAEWQETFVMALAKRLKLKYPVNDPVTDQKIDQMADGLFATLKSWDNEPASIYLQNDYGGYGAWR